MQRLEVFFDYACPYCEKAHGYLVELKSKLSMLTIAWQPCEAHPRPERYGRHSDLCIRGMYFAQQHGVDLWTYHERMYRAAIWDHADIEKVEVLARYVEDILDSNAFCQALLCGKYTLELARANDYAYEASSVWAVPAYRLAGHRLDAVEDVGVSFAQLSAFIGRT